MISWGTKLYFKMKICYYIPAFNWSELYVNVVSTARLPNIEYKQPNQIVTAKEM